MIKKPRSTKSVVNPYLVDGTAFDDLSPANRIAHDIFSQRRDLRPSVERIMNAGLTPDATERALTLFRDSLTNLADPHRNPLVAIANADTTPTE